MSRQLIYVYVYADRATLGGPDLMRILTIDVPGVKSPMHSSMRDHGFNLVNRSV